MITTVFRLGVDGPWILPNSKDTLTHSIESSYFLSVFDPVVLCCLAGFISAYCHSGNR